MLLVESPGQPVATLFPESNTSFRLAPDRGQVTFIFSAESDARASGLILHRARDLKAIRVRAMTSVAFRRIASSVDFASNRRGQ